MTPHLLLMVPPVWYEMHLKVNGENIRGVSLSGVPAILIGMNDYVAWDFTNVGADIIDFYYYVWDGEKYLYQRRVARTGEEG